MHYLYNKIALISKQIRPPLYVMIVYHARYPICAVLLPQKERTLNDSFGLRHDQFLTPGNKILVSTRMQLEP